MIILDDDGNCTLLGLSMANNVGEPLLSNPIGYHLDYGW